MGVPAEEERPVDASGPAMQADRLGDGEDVSLVEAGPERRAAVPGRAEGDALRRDGGFGRWAWYAARSRGTSTSSEGGAGFPARGCTCRSLMRASAAPPSAEVALLGLELLLADLTARVPLPENVERPV